eukprot:3915818-Prymnesium_polylepis.2
MEADATELKPVHFCLVYSDVCAPIVRRRCQCPSRATVLLCGDELRTRVRAELRVERRRALRLTQMTADQRRNCRRPEPAAEPQERRLVELTHGTERGLGSALRGLQLDRPPSHPPRHLLRRGGERRLRRLRRRRLPLCRRQRGAGRRVGGRRRRRGGRLRRGVLAAAGDVC